MRGHQEIGTKSVGWLNLCQLSSVIHIKVLSTLVAEQSARSLVYLEIRC